MKNFQKIILQILIEDWQALIVALIMALATFAWWNHAITKESVISVPVVLYPPDGWCFQGGKEEYTANPVNIKVRGTPNEIENFGKKNLQIEHRFKPPENSAEKPVRSVAEDLQPADFPAVLKRFYQYDKGYKVKREVFRLERRRYTLCAEGYTAGVRYPAIVPLTGSLGGGVRPHRVTFKPDTVELVGPGEYLAALDKVTFEKGIDLGGYHSQFNSTVPKPAEFSLKGVKIIWPADGVEATIIPPPESKADSENTGRSISKSK